MLLALWGGLSGAFVAGPLLAMAGAEILTLIYGGFEGAAAMGGGLIGGAIGVVAGFAGGLWLVLRKDGYWGGTAVAWLTGAAIMMAVCLGYVAFS
jgi:hypothetical protein